MNRIEEMINTIIRPKHRCYFIMDISNGYWTVQIKSGDKYKTGFVTPHSHNAYLRMGQSFIGAPYMYF